MGISCETWKHSNADGETQQRGYIENGGNQVKCLRLFSGNGSKKIFTQSTSSSLNNGSKDISYRYTEMKGNVLGILDDIKE